MAMLFGVLAICPGIICVILYLCGSWYDQTGSLEKTTIGNYGLVSTTSGIGNLSALLAADTAIVIVDASGLASFSSAKSEGNSEGMSCRRRILRAHSEALMFEQSPPTTGYFTLAPHPSSQRRC